MGIILNTEGTPMNMEKNKLRDAAETMDKITKALILTLLNSKEEKKRKDGKELKEKYLKDVIEKSLIQMSKDETKEEIRQRIKIEELDLEIQEIRLKTLKKIFAEKEG